MKKMDFHIHVTENSTNVEESIAYLTEYCRQNKLDGICIQAAAMSSKGFHPDCNEKCAAVAAANPNWYVFAGLHHDRDFVEQAKEYMAQGFKGIKLLEGKPSCYRHYGYGFDHPRFEPFFAYAEEHAIPLLIHNNDPLVHWDINKISKAAIAKGWYYDSTMPSQAYFFQVLEDILARHPKLHVALAHFGFYSNDLPRAEALMEKYPNLMMDMTPASVIFFELSQTPEATKAFILKYQDRLLFGTDVSNKIQGEVLALNQRKYQYMTAFYEGKGMQDVLGHAIAGMDLDEEILQKIYWDNAMRFMGIAK